MRISPRIWSRIFAAAVIAVGVAGAPAGAATTITIQQDVAIASTLPSDRSRIDFVNARPMPLPGAARISSATVATTSATMNEVPGIRRGHAGSGRQTPQNVGAPAPFSSKEVAPQAYGLASHPFTTARVDAYQRAVYRYYPFSAAGRLFFTIGANTYVCSAALIQPGVVVTAAHCVADFGTNTLFENFAFIPAYNKGNAPFGVWSVRRIYVKKSYLDGTDSCANPGVVCKNDVAVFTLKSQTDADSGAKYFAGTLAGWLSVAWDGYGYTEANQVQITQLGYPLALDSGARMQRTDSLGYVDSEMSGNTIIGSLQTGGSSGGPWIINLGVKPVLNGISYGNDADANVVVGVTSWGYTDSSYKQQGASRFTKWNIVTLLDSACTDLPSACE